MDDFSEPVKELEIQVQTEWNQEQKEELVKCLAVNLFWFVPALTFWTYLIAYLST